MVTSKKIGKRAGRAWCRECHAPIQWARNREGNPVPLDESPDPSGRWVIEKGRRTRPLRGVEWERAQEDGRLLFTNHMATCPARQSIRSPWEGVCPPHLRESLGLRPRGSDG